VVLALPKINSGSRASQVGATFDEVECRPDAPEVPDRCCGDIWRGYLCTLTPGHCGRHLAGVGDFGEHLFTAMWSVR
jgi:hypothetical protein